MNQPQTGNILPRHEVPPPPPEPMVAPAERAYQPVNVEAIDGGRPQYWEVLANPYNEYSLNESLDAALEVERWALLNAAERETYGSDAEVFQKFLSAMMEHFKSSDIVQKFRTRDFKPSGRPEPTDWKQLFSEFERARQYAFGKVDMSSSQRARLLAAKSGLNYSIRELALSGADNAMDCLLMVFPAQRRIHYMSSSEIIAYLKRSASVADTAEFHHQVKLDQAALNEYADLPQVQEALADPDFPDTHGIATAA
jgi:hypothetical protein